MQHTQIKYEHILLAIKNLFSNSWRSVHVPLIKDFKMSINDFYIWLGYNNMYADFVTCVNAGSFVIFIALATVI